MIVQRRPLWPVRLALVSTLAVAIMQPLRGDTDGESADEVPTEARIERLRDAIEREREALERERDTRRSMEDELGRMRDELERTRDELEELEGEVEAGD